MTFKLSIKLLDKAFRIPSHFSLARELNALRAVLK
jgi:hypothetical protein